MAWLALHMWFLLLLAFLLGLLLGWWIWRCRDIAPATTAPQAAYAAPQSARAAAPAPPARPTGKAPKLYDSPTDGPSDDLKKVKGIGPGIEKLLNSIGIFYYRQIADWGPDEVTWVDNKLQFPGRITREDWISQSKVLRDGGQTEFANRYEKGETPSSYHGAPKNTSPYSQGTFKKPDSDN